METLVLAFLAILTSLGAIAVTCLGGIWYKLGRVESRLCEHIRDHQQEGQYDDAPRVRFHQ